MNREAIKAGLKALYRSGDVIEIRAFDRAGGLRPSLTGRYKYGAALLNVLVQLDEQEYDLYYVLNPTPLAEKAMEQGEGTKEIDVLTRRWIFLDGDSVRHTCIGEKLNKKTSEMVPTYSKIATDSEWQAAVSVMAKIRVELTERGWRGIVQPSSGNGCHLLIPVDLPNLKDGRVDEEVKTKITELQRILSVTYSTADVKIECFPDASRLTRAYGSLNRKSKESETQFDFTTKITTPLSLPRRRSGVIEGGEGGAEVKPITRADIEQFVTAKRHLLPSPDPVREREFEQTGTGPWNDGDLDACLKAWSEEHDEFSYQDAKTSKGPGYAIMCPGNYGWADGEQHEDILDNVNGSAVVWIQDGWPCFRCGHAHCDVGAEHGKKKWHDLADYYDEERELFDYPGMTEDPSWINELPPQEQDPHPVQDHSPALVSNKEPKLFSFTDAGNMERLVYWYGDGFKFCPQRGWYIWDGKRWAADAIGKVQRAALLTVRAIPELETPFVLATLDPAGHNLDKKKVSVVAFINKFAKSSESRKGLEAMKALSKSAAGIAGNISEFDPDNWLFNCQNATLGLYQRENHPHKPKDMITSVSPVVYDPTATCPTWDQFLLEIMEGSAENIGFLQRAAGYSLTGSAAEQCMFVLWGNGQNGKTTFLEVLRYIIGDYGKVASMGMFLDTDYSSIPHDLAALAGVRFVSATESKEGRRLDEPKIKAITGGDTISARFLHREWFEFRPEFKIWLSTNHRPAIKGTRSEEHT